MNDLVKSEPSKEPPATGAFDVNRIRTALRRNDLLHAWQLIREAAEGENSSELIGLTMRFLRIIAQRVANIDEPLFDDLVGIAADMHARNPLPHNVINSVRSAIEKLKDAPASRIAGAAPKLTRFVCAIGDDDLLSSYVSLCECLMNSDDQSTEVLATCLIQVSSSCRDDGFGFVSYQNVVRVADLSRSVRDRLNKASTIDWSGA